MKNPPLPYDEAHHRWRWVVLPSWRVLHRVSQDGRTEASDWAEGLTVCGRRGQLFMPGILSRLGLRRCDRCCAALGISPGFGIPVNDPELGVLEQAS